MKMGAVVVEAKLWYFGQLYLSTGKRNTKQDECKTERGKGGLNISVG